MGWEEKNGRSYYYKKQRQGNKVTSVYMGTGMSARLEADMVELQAAQRKREQAEYAAFKAEVDKHQGAVQAAIERNKELLTAAMIASGYYQHKRQWRPKGEQKNIEEKD